MKLQINGFDIELTTDETTMTLKVLDSTGKELSNNTYNQVSETSDQIISSEVPTPEETAANPDATTSTDTTTDTTTVVEPIGDGSEEEVSAVESLLMPDFDKYKVKS